MSSEVDLAALAEEIEQLEGKFVHSSSSGYFLKTDDQAEFKRIVVEAKSILDAELGRANDFSMNLISSINSGSDGFFGGPSMAKVKETRKVLVGSLNHLRRRHNFGVLQRKPTSPAYIDTTRLAELRGIVGQNWDMARLVRLCEELNIAHENGCLMSIAMLVRAILDHIPPIFGCKNFAEVVNNYPGSKSFRGSMQHLDKALRHVADSLLHQQIRKRESLPSPTQVDFRAGVDVLLGEIVRVLG
ncbi:hypothetical protein HCU74_13915 [Spongiibacter sp. KMU-166]|uniref:Uncharacterized protein n=1 Tax=Spongiibacter thalassae TaxID=2721624 RepID=A0ABX1GH67_9GAMM|nr:hypothetical protein [Spongiibacter thalassae]NKI18508.1 hypothetical protein [Spongiibacter thalassae]